MLSVFDHPIMFGYYVGAVFGLSHLVLGYQKRLASRSFKSATVAATAFLSLSAGPIGAVVDPGIAVDVERSPSRRERSMEAPDLPAAVPICSD